MTQSSSTDPIEALFGADNGATTSQGNRPYLKSVPDPISAAYGVPSGTGSGGMSSKGASRWGFGHTSSRGPVAVNNPYYPHDADGNGNYWSVTLNNSGQILTHYYTDIHLRSQSTAIISPDNRWIPLDIQWSGVCPPFMYHGQNCTAIIQLQNVGIVDWNCNSSSYVLTYRWVRFGNRVDGANQAAVCGIVRGASTTINVSVSDIPNWGAGTYSLQFDVARIQAGQKYWFGYGNWPSYNVSVCVDRPCETYMPKIQK